MALVAGDEDRLISVLRLPARDGGGTASRGTPAGGMLAAVFHARRHARRRRRRAHDLVVIDAASGEVVREIPHRDTAVIAAVAVSPDGRTVVDGELRQHRAAVGPGDGREHRACGPATSGGCGRWRFLPDGKTVVSAGEDRTLRLWDVPARDAISRIDRPRRRRAQPGRESGRDDDPQRRRERRRAQVGPVAAGAVSRFRRRRARPSRTPSTPTRTTRCRQTARRVVRVPRPHDWAVECLERAQPPGRRVAAAPGAVLLGSGRPADAAREFRTRTARAKPRRHT